MTQRPKKPFHQVRDAVRLKHYCYCAEQFCVNWIILHIFVHTVAHPIDMTTASLAAIPANEDIRAGRMQTFESVNELLADLEAE